MVNTLTGVFLLGIATEDMEKLMLPDRSLDLPGVLELPRRRSQPVLGFIETFGMPRDGDDL